MGAARKSKASKSVAASAAPILVTISEATGLTFAVRKGDLRNALTLLASVADAKSTMPILAHVTIRPIVGSTTAVTLTSTDLNVSLRLTLAATVEDARADGISVPAKALLALIKSMPDGDITLAGVRTGAVVAAGTMRAAIIGASVRDTPKFPEPNEAIGRTFTSCDAGELVAMLASVGASVCKDETRFHLNGTFLMSDNNTTVAVTTDGHRLAKATHDALTLNAHGVCPDLGKGVIVPRKGVSEIARLLAKQTTCDVAVKMPHVYVRRADGALLVIKAIDAQFPPYEQVIPTGHKRDAIVDIEALVGALERAKVHCTETRGVRITLAAGKVRVQADNPDVGETTETLEAEYAGKDHTFGVNPRYLLDALASLEGDERVVLSTGDVLDPILVVGADDYAMRPIRSERFLAVVMPMRV